MSYTNKVIDLSKYEKYGKKKEVELASERVDLALVDEIESAEKKASKSYESAIKTLLKILSDLDSAISDAKTAVSIASNMMPKVKDLDKKAKELGVKLDPKINKAAQNLFDISETGGKQTLKDLEKMKSII